MEWRFSCFGNEDRKEELVVKGREVIGEVKGGG